MRILDLLSDDDWATLSAMLAENEPELRDEMAHERELWKARRRDRVAMNGHGVRDVRPKYHRRLERGRHGYRLERME